RMLVSYSNSSEEEIENSRLPLPGSVLDMRGETGPLKCTFHLFALFSPQSKTVVLRHHWIQPFIQSLRTGLAHGRRFISLAEKLKVYSNDDKTRTLLAMEVSTGQAQLLELMKAVDGTMEDVLQIHYSIPTHHCSLSPISSDTSCRLSL
uniref:U6 snRNA phosphodiesterase 1 n=1 Tax=Oncorhynchus mykiss TaxID=8022 RepID=A0A8K9VD91_ONCMY